MSAIPTQILSAHTAGRTWPQARLAPYAWGRRENEQEQGDAQKISGLEHRYGLRENQREGPKRRDRFGPGPHAPEHAGDPVETDRGRARGGCPEGRCKRSPYDRKVTHWSPDPMVARSPGIPPPAGELPPL